MTAPRNEKHSQPIPLLLEYTSEDRERARQEDLYEEQPRTLRWCIAPLVFLGTMIPASALLIRLLQVQSRPTDAMHHGITLIPTLSVGVDLMGMGVVLVSILGLFGVAKGCRRLMNVYFGFVLCFIAVQVVYAVMGFMSGTSWIQEALERSWDKAYESDKTLVRDLQTEFSCQGFHSQDDRAVFVTSAAEGHLPPCGEILQMRFGKRLQRLGTLILCIRLIQLTGVFLLSILFKHLAVAEDAEDKTGDGVFFLTEKQLEDQNARVPLLADDEDELPHYSVDDHYQDESQDESDDESDDDEDEEAHLGRFCREGFGAEDYHYRDLPEYAEDERETQVYVA